MSYFFDVFGPFEIGRDTNSWSHASFKQALEDKYGWGDHLALSIGCYAFCLQRGRSIKPWYIGKTIAKKGLSFEAVAPRNVKIYSKIIENAPGDPLLFLFPLMTGAHNRFAKGSSSESIILWLEDTLMGMAFARNPDIANVSGMRFRRSVNVLGLIGPRNRGRPHAEVNSVRAAFLD